MAGNPAAVAAGTWVKLDTVPFKGKQDAIDFVTRDLGWYGNGQGKVYQTEDGGASWHLQTDKPGTYVRALAFVDDKIGFLGNIGPDYFPGVSDPQPLYRTTDGGTTWQAVSNVTGPAVKGICAIDVLRTPFINAGHLDYRTTIRAAGRVGGPAFLMTSKDMGESFVSEDLSASTAMILDVKFVDEDHGFIAGASHKDIDSSHARILKTSDGGKSWRVVYESDRPWETTWKMSFPSKKVGYVTVQNYDPAGPAARVVAKTTDGGETWSEVPLAKDASLQEFGVGFVDETHGYIGGSTTGMATEDGGQSWRPVDMGHYANKIKIVKDADRTTLYAVGMDVYKLDLARTPSE
jgi:photosystem II stability/assembly factor-like uncharacterized protein